MSIFRSLGGLFTSPPAIISWGQDELNLFAFAVGTDQALWYAQLDGFSPIGDPDRSGWSEWRSLGGVVTSRPCAVRSGDLSVDVFAAGAHSELLHWQFRNGAWTNWPLVSTEGLSIARAPHITPPTPHRNWRSLGGILTSPPHSTLFGELNDTILVFALGTDHALWSKTCNQGLWQDWNSLGNVLSSPPHAVTWQKETFAVFARGIDSAIWYTMGADWHKLPATFSSTSYAVASADHIHVFAADTQSVLQHCKWNGNSWSDWELLGGILMFAPTANSFPFNEVLHVYAVGTDSAAKLRRFDGTSWGGWESLDGQFISPCAALARRAAGTPTRDIVALGTDHALWHLEIFDP